MRSRSYKGWLSAGLDAWALGVEASAVIGLRTSRLASGGEPARREAALMGAEKIGAGLELQTALPSAGAGLTPLSGTRKALRHYRRKVAANRRRLSR